MRQGEPREATRAPRLWPMLAGPDAGLSAFRKEMRATAQQHGDPLNLSQQQKGDDVMTTLAHKQAPTKKRTVDHYRRHAELYGPEGVYEASAEFPPRQRAALALFLSRLEGRPDPSSRTGRTLPRCRLSPRQRASLVGDLIEDGVSVAEAAKLVGCAVHIARRLAGDRRAMRVIEAALREGPIDVRTCSPEVVAAWQTAYSSKSPAFAPGTSVNTGDARPHTRFGRLVVIRNERGLDGRRVAVCRCDCGKTKTANLSKLRAGRVKSCGCLREERREAMRRK